MLKLPSPQDLGHHTSPYKNHPAGQGNHLSSVGILLVPLAILTLIFASPPAQAHSTDELGSSPNGNVSHSPRADTVFEFKGQSDPVSLVETLRQAVRLLPEVPEYRFKLADALLRLGDLEAAITEIRSAIAIQKDDGHAQHQLGLLLMAKQEWRAASVALKEAVRLEPDLVHAHYSLGIVHSALGDVPTAIQSLRRSIELRPKFFDAHYRLAMLLKKTRQRHEARDHLEVAASGGVPQAQVLLGQAYRTGQGKEANLGLAIYWWMEAAALGQRTASDSLSTLRRHAVVPGIPRQHQAELVKGFESYRAKLWKDFPEMSQPRGRQSLGKVLLEHNRVDEAIPILLKECLALSEEAHTELSTLYEIGWEPYLKPFEKKLLSCVETTAADGFVPAKNIVAGIRARGLGVTTNMGTAQKPPKGLPK